MRHCTLDLNSIEDYRKFLRIKSLPTYSFTGRTAYYPEEYAEAVEGRSVAVVDDWKYEPWPGLWDYQRDISAMALRKKKFCAFVRCGFGKTLILLEFARNAAMRIGKKRVLIVSPLMVIKQTIAEAKRFYGDALPIEQVAACDLAEWMKGEGGIGITNYEAIVDGLERCNVGALILDESSLLKSMYGAWGTRLIEIGKGLEYKLCCTGTPAPNDRIEYGNHAVFMDAFPNLNSFLARYFVNRAQTSERWELKQHAIKPFYRDLAHWCIFLTNPAVYGWKDNINELPPVHLHVDRIDITEGQRHAMQDMTGNLIMMDAGGIGTRAKLAKIGKGFAKDTTIKSHKPEFMRKLCESFPDESCIIWCKFNDEQDALNAMFKGSESIQGSTPIAERERIIADFQSGKCRILISKARVLGFGLNLQICTRMIFSGLHDSWEEFHQCISRASRCGATLPLNVHIPITELEEPMVQTVLTKAKRIEQDTREQEEMFRVSGLLRKGSVLCTTC